MERVIVKVRENKSNKQKIITVPSDATEIKVGDYVELIKV